MWYAGRERREERRGEKKKRKEGKRGSRRRCKDTIVAMTDAHMDTRTEKRSVPFTQTDKQTECVLLSVHSEFTCQGSGFLSVCISVCAGFVSPASH